MSYLTAFAAKVWNLESCKYNGRPGNCLCGRIVAQLSKY